MPLETSERRCSIMWFVLYHATVITGKKIARRPVPKSFLCCPLEADKKASARVQGDGSRGGEKEAGWYEFWMWNHAVSSVWVNWTSKCTCLLDVGIQRPEKSRLKQPIYEWSAHRWCKHTVGTIKYQKKKVTFLVARYLQYQLMCFLLAIAFPILQL